MNRKSIVTNAFLNTLKTVLSYVFLLVTTPYVMKVLQVNAIGVFDFCNSVVSYFVLIAGLGVGTYAIREGTRYRENAIEIKRFVSEIFSINVYSTIVSYALLFLSLILIPKLQANSIAILILSIEIVFTTIGVSWVCNIYEDFWFIALQSIGVQALSLVLTLLFVKEPSDLYIYIIIVAFSKSASNIINFIYIRTKYCHFVFTLDCNIKKHFKPILTIFSTAIAMTIYVSADTTMIGFIFSEYQVGLYGTAAKIYQIVKNVLASVLIVLVPRFVLLLKNPDKNVTNSFFSKVFNILIVLIFPATIGLVITSEDVIRLAGDENYLGGADALKLLSLAIAFSLIATLYASCILIPKRKEKTVFKATVISAITNVALNFVFIPILGINGAAITTIIAEAIVCAIFVFDTKGEVKLQGVIKNFISVVLGCIGIAIVGYFCFRYFDYYLYRLSITIVASVIIYALILGLMRNPVLLEGIQRFRMRRSNHI